MVDVCNNALYAGIDAVFCLFLVDTSIDQKNITLTSARKIQEAQHY